MKETRQDRFQAALQNMAKPDWACEPDLLSQDPLVLQSYSQDLWPRKLLELRENGPVPPTVDAVLWPSSTSEVVEAVKWARAADFEVYPYGAGSGVCGATIPSVDSGRPRVIFDLKRMRKIRSLDKKSGIVTAEAGWIGENLERALNAEGFTLGHFPSSIYCSSLGGYLATRSAGQLSTKYGKIEDMVVSLETVMPDGTVIETGRAPRSAMGPDWTQFLLGTEGTLCLFTAAALQVHALPENHEMLGFGADSVPRALTFARRLMQNGLRPAVLRIYDGMETALAGPSQILKESGFNGSCAIIVIFEGCRALTKVEASEAKRMASELEIENLGPKLAEHWWEHRYAVSYKQPLLLSHDRVILDTFECAATWDKLEGLYQAVKKTPLGFGVMLAHFSHFYHTGANIYFTVVGHSGLESSALPRYDQIWESMLRAANDAGATLSHHHGVGIQKNRWIRDEKGSLVAVFGKVKRAFDPENRFNPGKMGL